MPTPEQVRQFYQNESLEKYNTKVPKQPTFEEWANKQRIEGGRKPNIPNNATNYDHNRLLDPNRRPAPPNSANPFKDIPKAPPEAPPSSPPGAGAGASTAAVGAGASAAAGKSAGAAASAAGAGLGTAGAGTGVAGGGATGAGAGGGGGGAAAGFAEAAAPVVVGAGILLGLDFIFNPNNNIADDTQAAKGKPDPRHNGTLPGLYPPDAPKPTEPVPPPPFTGGQMPVKYNVTYAYYFPGANYPEQTAGIRLWGPITGNTRVTVENNVWLAQIECRGEAEVSSVQPQLIYQSVNYGPVLTSPARNLRVISVTRVDGLPDTGGDPPAPPYTGGYTSGGGTPTFNDPFDFVSPSAPSAPPALTAPALPDKLPGVRPPRAPQPDPTVAQPDPVGSPDPQKVPQTNPTSRTFWDPIPSQVTPSSGIGPERVETEINEPVVPIPRVSNPVPKTGTPVENKPGQAPTPAGQPTPTPTPKATSSSPSPDSSAPPWWAYVAFPAIVGALTPLINNTSPSAIGTAVCNTFAPGGCNADVRQNAKDAADNSAANKNLLERIFDGLGNTASLANLAMIPKILTKLTKFVDWSVGDRVIGIMSMVASVHNAFMLSNNVGQTLFSIFDNLGNTGKLIVNPEGDANIDSASWVTSNLDSLFSTMLGAEVWKSVKTSYRAANNIFSTSSNMYDNLRSIHNDSQELLNMVRRDTAELGNALVEEGVISEDNWDIRDPKLKIKSKMLNRLDRMNRGLEDLDNKLEAIEQLTSTLLNIANSAKEIRENTDKLGKELGDANQAFKDTRDKAIEALPDFDFDIDDLF